MYKFCLFVPGTDIFFDFPRFKFNKFDVRQQGISLKYCFVPVPMA